MDRLKVRTVECVSFGLIFCPRTILWLLITSPFQPQTPLSLSLEWFMCTLLLYHALCYDGNLLFLLLWTPDFSDKRGVKTLQHLEKQSRFPMSLLCDTNFLCSDVFLFSFLFFFSRIEKHECCGGWTLQKANVFDFNVIFVTIEVYIFIRIFGLYSDPVTDCTFVGNVLSSSPQQNPHLPLWGPCWYLTPDFFPTFALRSRESSMLASVHFSQVGRSVYFVT